MEYGVFVTFSSIHMYFAMAGHVALSKNEDQQDTISVESLN